MFSVFKNKPMLFAALLSAAVSVTAFFCRQMTLVMGILLITLLFLLAVKRVRGTVIFAVFVSLLVLMSVMLTYRRIDAVDKLSGNTLSGEFIVCSPAASNDKYSSAVLEYNGRHLLEKGTRLLVFYKGIKLSSGDIIEASVKLRSLRGSEYRYYSYSEGILATGSLFDASVKRYDKEHTIHITDKIRRYISATLSENLSENEAATLNAITVGDSSGFSEDFSGQIRRSGVSHVMVVSGMHLAIIVTAVFSLLERVFYNRFVKAILSFVMVVFMMAVCGFTMSIMRAGITYILMTAALILNSDSDTINTLGGALSLILISSPFAIFSVSLQLSVLSTFGILVLMPWMSELICRYLRINNTFVRAVVDIVAGSIPAMIMTLPVVIWCFGYVSVVAVLTNVLISHAVTAALIITAPALVINLLPYSDALVKPLFLAAGVVTKYINHIITALGSPESASVQVSRPFVLAALTAIAAILMIIDYCNRKKNRLELKAEKHGTVTVDGSGI